MPETDKSGASPQPLKASGDATMQRWQRLLQTISAKLLVLLIGALLAIFGALGFVNIRLHRQHLESVTLVAAERNSDVVKRSTSHYMMRNDREGLYEIIRTMADEPGIKRIRIINQEGLIRYSSDSGEVNRQIDKNAEACYACHVQAAPLTKLNRPDRFRIYRENGERVLGIITPIENQESCSNAACHAHPKEQQILGVLDVDLSLAKADAALAESSWTMIGYTLIASVLICLAAWLFVWRVVHEPLGKLKAGTERLTHGDLGYQLELENQSHDEVGELAHSFNEMSSQLRNARDEITAWNRTLEDRVLEKTSELKKAAERMLHVEKMATIGKMAAVVAHEINNPLSGILTYSKLVKRWIEKGIFDDEPKRHEMAENLDLVATESRRCGDLVKNLLSFSRTNPINLEWIAVNPIVDRVVKLAAHKLEMGGIQIHVDTASDMPVVHADAAQIEQVLLALTMNAIDAMPHGGNLWIATTITDHSELLLQVKDDGMGISSEILPRLFEPFLTTKDTGKGVGLGLAISHNIVERHNGRIEVDSQVGRGTTFNVYLPLSDESYEFSPAAANQDAMR
ncbi:periplasmic sensor signal transduction histidine kinase [Candidatus Koribacter versatilis Ellin345]|uniref:histidine kinase n=1 Tax=Koribacter versatilis (strain Ellin345) TaxID=204669 RepID=Q1INE6_KORVE|nr:HAMP domain-containing sensor histidine kinase [Candidatus Koribacter versatilis]ABF41604.1 periplasmic sensor signal transduction histidine kinase [Candidatus Koribacter versatilis Ellin345]